MTSLPSSPEDMAARLDAMCLALPEVTRLAEGWARKFDIRRRTFCFFSGRESTGGGLAPILVLRATPEEHEALLAIGAPFSDCRAGFGRFEVALGAETDWDEIRELVTDSYRLLAPKKLAALLD